MPYRGVPARLIQSRSEPSGRFLLSTRRREVLTTDGRGLTRMGSNYRKLKLKTEPQKQRADNQQPGLNRVNRLGCLSASMERG
jgi:hypothetical protein